MRAFTTMLVAVAMLAPITLGSVCSRVAHLGLRMGRVAPRMHDGDTMPTDEVLRRCPYEIVGVGRNASKLEIQRAYRARARTLHPDVSDDPQSGVLFRELVAAWDVLRSREPGSRESHVLWPYLSSLDQYWAREQGHDTAEQLEMYLRDLGMLDEYLAEHRLAESESEALAAAADADAAAPTAASATEHGGAAGVDTDIAELLGYRIFLGSEQWQVRWVDGSLSWERWGVLDSEQLRQQAAEERRRTQRDE